MGQTQQAPQRQETSASEMTYSDMQRNLESLQSKIRDLQNKIGRKDLLSLDNNSSNGNDNDYEQKPVNELRP